MKESFFSLFQKEAEELGERGLHSILDAGRKWDVSGNLKEGGSVVFPHAFLRRCGEQVAAAVHGCLDSGADQVLVLGVDHCLSEERKEVRRREFCGENLSLESCRGVFDHLEGEFSLLPFLILWNAEIKRRGARPPRLVIRYPSFVNSSPESLPGMEELKRLTRDSVVVATGDLTHHGLAYQMNRDESLPMGNEAMEMAREGILEGFRILNKGHYAAFLNHTYVIKSDGKDSLSTLRYLKGPQKATILDLKLVDTSGNFEGDVDPSWVATALVYLT